MILLLIGVVIVAVSCAAWAEWLVGHPNGAKFHWLPVSTAMLCSFTAGALAQSIQTELEKNRSDQAHDR